MSTLRQFTTVMCIASFATLPGTSAIASADDDGFVAAMQIYRDGHYPNAYGRLAVLAEGGHAEAARIALPMVRNGPQLYGSDWPASTHQIERRSELASIRQPYFAPTGGD